MQPAAEQEAINQASILEKEGMSIHSIAEAY